MRPTTTAAVILGLCAVTEGATKADNGFDTLTEWSVPFTDANPFQIAMAGANVVYLRDNPEQRLGLLEVDRARFTEWPLPYLVTSPGDIKVRAGDGAVFVAGLSENEIGQFDLQTQALRRWRLPLDIESGGPFSLGIDEVGGVFFTAYNASGALIGRLDTTSATVTTWQLPAAIGDATRVTVAPGGPRVLQRQRRALQPREPGRRHRGLHGLGTGGAACVRDHHRPIRRRLLSGRRKPGYCTVDPLDGTAHGVDRSRAGQRGYNHGRRPGVHGRHVVDGGRRRGWRRSIRPSPASTVW
jgi:hypothetical protein